MWRPPRRASGARPVGMDHNLWPDVKELKGVQQGVRWEDVPITPSSHKQTDNRRDEGKEGKLLRM